MMLYEEAESSTLTRRGEAPSKLPAPVVPLWTSEKEPPPYGAQHYQDALWKGGNEALPPRWHQFKVLDRTEYQDDTFTMVSWNRPLPGVRLDFPGDLVDPGCEWHISPHGRSYFVNHNTRTTSWKKPRPARPAGSLTPECIIEGHTKCIWSLACLKASCNVMSASGDGSIRQWKRDGEPVGKPLNSDVGGISSMAVSPDETMVICGSIDGRIRLWNIKEGSTIGDPWEGHTAAVRCLDWSPNALEIASGSQDGTIRRWNPNTGRQIAPPIETSHVWVIAVKYSPQSDKFMSSGHNHVICVWSRDGKLLIEIKGHDNAVTSLCWSKDGTHIFSGSGDGTIRKWQATDGKELVVLRGHTHTVTSLCLTPNESYIVSASNDFSIRIWDLKTNQAFGDPLLHDDEVFAVAMSPDGKYIASAVIDKKIYVWSLEVALDRQSRDQGANDAKPKGRPTQRVVRQPIQVEKIGLTRYGNDFFGNESDWAPRRAVPPPSPSSSTRWRRLLSSMHFGTQPANASSFFRSQVDTHEEIEFSQYPGRPHVVEVAAVRDREVIFTAPPPPPPNTQQQTQSHGQGSSTTPPAPGTNPTTPPRHPHSLPVRLLAHLVLFLCCASPQHASGNVQPMQQQGQPQGQAHAHASSQTQPVPLSTSTIPTPVITHAASPVAENV